MMDVFAVADILIKNIKTHYPDDIAIAGYYGSYQQGRATERSDLDFFFIPATPRGYEVSLQFIIDGISFDFWPISWERSERMASFAEWNTTIIADCELLYVRSEEDRARFMKLRETIASIQNATEPTSAIIDHAEQALKDAYFSLAKLRIAAAADHADLTGCRTGAVEIAIANFKSLALLNRTYYTRGFGHYLDQVKQLPIKPESDKLDQYFNTIMFGTDPLTIIKACEQLTADTGNLIAEQRRHTNGAATRNYAATMKGYYEEERGMLNKLLTACERGHYETAFFAAINVQDTLAKMLYTAEKGHWPSDFDGGEYREYYNRYGFPDLIALLNPADFEPLRIAVLNLIDQIERHLRQEGVHLNQFESIAQFESFVNGQPGLNR